MRAPQAGDAEALAGRFTVAELEAEFARSDEVVIGLADGKVVCAFGLIPVSMIGRDYTLWLFTTDELAHWRMSFLRRNKEYCRRVSAGRDLYCFVEAGFAASRRWVEWLGFSLYGDCQINGAPLVVYKYGVSP